MACALAHGVNGSLSILVSFNSISIATCVCAGTADRVRTSCGSQEMLTLIGTLGGAAAMKLLNKKNTPKDVKELQKTQEKLGQLVKELEREAQDANKEKEAALQALRKQAEELKASHAS